MSSCDFPVSMFNGLTFSDVVVVVKRVVVVGAIGANAVAVLMTDRAMIDSFMVVVWVGVVVLCGSGRL